MNRTGYPLFVHYWSLYTCDHCHGVGPSVLDFNTKDGPQLQTVTAAGLDAIMAHEPRQYPSFPRKPLGWHHKQAAASWWNAERCVKDLNHG